MASGTFGQGSENSIPVLQTPEIENTAERNSQTVTHAQRVARAEALLAAGHAEQAQEVFEQAAQLEHSAEIELGILRSQMQVGAYQEALAFAAHTAGAHPEVGAGAALYCWLLYLGGQETIALRTLEKAEQRLPADAALARVRSLLSRFTGYAHDSNEHAVTQVDLAPHERLMPYAFGAVVPEHSRVVGGAVLLRGGTQAIAPLRSLSDNTELWLRNGLGHTVHATIERRDTAAGLARISLDQALEEPATQGASRDAFPGSGAYVVGYFSGPGQQAAWPFTRIGFLGMPRAPNMPRPLGIALPTGIEGAPVFDLQGRLVGLVLPQVDRGEPHFGGIGSLRAFLDLSSTSVDQPVSARRNVAEIYEQALRIALQVIVPVPDQDKGGG
jgi:tetratricopeptide (TPR) repeat protein